MHKFCSPLELTSLINISCSYSYMKMQKLSTAFYIENGFNFSRYQTGSQSWGMRWLEKTVSLYFCPHCISEGEHSHTWFLSLYLSPWMYKWYFRIVDHIYHVLDPWDINGFVVFLLSCFHSDYDWKTITDVINTWHTAEWGWCRNFNYKLS